MGWKVGRGRGGRRETLETGQNQTESAGGGRLFGLLVSGPAGLREEFGSRREVLDFPAMVVRLAGALWCLTG